MTKVPKVLGEIHAPKFLGTQLYSNNNTRPVYNLPKREACLMAMSYSYELQAKVFDRMTELEASQAPALPDFSNPVAAAHAWALINTTPLTMTSLELVDFINQQRKEGEAVLRHADLLAKVPLVLGGGERNFSFTYRDSQNKERPCYRFPKREACLMAMSYSYELQAKVFDRMTELEASQAPALPDFSNPVAAAHAWALINTTPLTMSSREIASIIGKKHKTAS